MKAENAHFEVLGMAMNALEDGVMKDIFVLSGNKFAGHAIKDSFKIE